MQPHPAALGGSNPVRPSPVFLLVVAAVAATAWLCVTQPDAIAGYAIDDGLVVFAFVVSGWILSLIFHEFAHAYTAWRGGDASVVSKGYLTLDPRRYTEPLTSIALPLFFLIIGGIALPGGAVWINRAALRSRFTESLVSLAGPATNLVFAACCLLPLTVGIVDPADQPVLAPALAVLGYFQILAFVLNMLPIPGLDGFGALEPFLPDSVRTLLAPVRQFAILILVLLIWRYDALRDAFFDTINDVMGVFSIPDGLTADGWDLFRFWRN